jgi:hypothetical protein
MWFTMQLGLSQRVVQQQKVSECGAMDAAIECCTQRCAQGEEGSQSCVASMST